MKYHIKVHANSSREKIDKTDKGFEIWIKEKPVNGKANSAIIKLFRKKLQKKIKIISGLNSGNKIIEVLE